LLAIGENGAAITLGASPLHHDLEQADKLGRKVRMHAITNGALSDSILSLVREDRYDLVIIGLGAEPGSLQKSLGEVHSLLRQVPCRVFLAAPQAIPQEPEQ
jgi:hypothetical protein